MSSFEKDMRHAVEFIPDRFYFVALSNPPPQNANKHFFSIDNEMVYWNFYLDFGPLNLAHVYRYCMLVNSKLNDPKLSGKVIYHYSHTHAHKRTNAAFLICAWALLCQERSPEDAFKPFKNYVAPFPPWHDATPSPCSFVLTILDTLRGLQKAREHRFFDFNNFNVEEYEHYEQVENGDLNWVLEGKFVAFAGPHADREFSAGGYHTLRPDDYVSYFKKKNVTLVVRLNKSYYDAKRFTNHGIDHTDMYFLDGSNPPDHILAKFLQRTEDTPGAVAVHCKAGLGRTGTTIGCFMMKHYRITAEEVIGWLRIVRPGSVIGPQQQYLKDMQQRMWRDGDLLRASKSPVPHSLPLVHSASGGSGRAESGSSASNSASNSRPGTSQSSAAAAQQGTTTPHAPSTPQTSARLSANLHSPGSPNATTSRLGKLSLNASSGSPTSNGTSANMHSPGSPDRVSSAAGRSSLLPHTPTGSGKTSSLTGSSTSAGGSFRTPPVSPKPSSAYGSNRETTAPTSTLSNYFRSTPNSSGKHSSAAAAAAAAEEASQSQGDYLRQQRMRHMQSPAGSSSKTGALDPISTPTGSNGSAGMNSPGSPNRPRSRLGSLLGSWKS